MNNKKNAAENSSSSEWGDVGPVSADELERDNSTRTQNECESETDNDDVKMKISNRIKLKK